MDRYFKWGLTRTWNFYKIEDRLKALENGKQYCPVCIKEDCGHSAQTVGGDTAKSILRWWQEVIIMECKKLPYLLVGKEGEYIYPKLVLQPTTTEDTIFVPENCTLGTLFGNDFYPAGNEISKKVKQFTSLPMYGWLDEKEKFEPFKRFENGYLYDTTVNQAQSINGRLLRVPQGKITPLEFIVDWF